VIPATGVERHNAGMATSILSSLSDDLAQLTAAGAGSVVQVAGARRPASGVVHGADTIITTARAIGREDGLRVRLPDGTAVDADLAGWDPSSGVAVLRTRTPITLTPPRLSTDAPRTGEIVLALARSWSTAITASTGIVAVVGGPLRTGRRRQMEQVIRVTAPLHDGFAGGAVFGASGALLGIATAAHIRGYGVVIPASIAWASASQLLVSGTPRRGYIGVAVHPVELPAAQRTGQHDRALLVIGVSESGPAATAGMHVGDLIVAADGKPTSSPEDLLDQLSGRSAGETILLSTLRGGAAREVSIVIGERA
jgi:S1-C subfamily serine protease